MLKRFIALWNAFFTPSGPPNWDRVIHDYTSERTMTVYDGEDPQGRPKTAR